MSLFRRRMRARVLCAVAAAVLFLVRVPTAQSGCAQVGHRDDGAEHDAQHQVPVIITVMI